MIHLLRKTVMCEIKGLNPYSKLDARYLFIKLYMLHKTVLRENNGLTLYSKLNSRPCYKEPIIEALLRRAHHRGPAGAEENFSE